MTGSSGVFSKRASLEKLANAIAKVHAKKKLRAGRTKAEKYMASKTVAKKNMTVYRSGPRMLLVDLDKGAELNQSVLKIIKQEFKAKIVAEWPSKSGKGKHVVIHVHHPISSASRIALQACLGSDPKREALAIAMIEQPSVLYKPKGVYNDK